MLQSLGHVTDPKAVITNHDDGLVHFAFTHAPTYTEADAAVELQVLLEKNRDGMRISIFQSPSEIEDIVSTAPSDLKAITTQFEIPLLRLDQPWPLQTVRVPKPWGAEIWYTGIEERGVCQAGGMPLTWLLQVLPSATLASAAEHDPLLLKILDPLPDPSLGDLYFELHEKKIEVYIVTHVDRAAWPDGIGKIRYGFDQNRLAEFSTSSDFKAAYLEAVKNYQTCRDKIDQLLEGHRLAEGIGANDPVSPALMSSWLAQVPARLATDEKTLRARMESFTYFRDIQVGDVIKVEPFFPHSLQHGVRVIEFQTASYERHILSFGQKVLTQNHWDTETALEQAITSMPPDEAFEVVPSNIGTKVEIVADFSAFIALRITVTANGKFELPQITDYRLLICADGQMQLGEQTLLPEDACFIPASATEKARTLVTQSGCVCIVAIPRS